MAGILSAISIKPIIHVQKSKINHRYYFNNNDSFYSIFYRLCIWLKPVSMFFKKAQKLQPPVYKGKAKKGRGISSALRCRCLCPWGLLFSGVYRCPLCTFCTVCSFPLSLSPAPPMSSHSFVSWHEIFLVHEYYYNKKAEFFEHSFLS